MAGTTDNNWEVDPNSYANVNNFKVNHMKLNLKTEFERKALTGYVVNEVEIVDNSVNKFILDTRGLKVFSASWVKKDGSEVSLDFVLSEVHKMYGQALSITFTDEMLKESKVNVKINYETTPECTACQWLEPSQTEGKKYPYLYTQCEAVHARSVVPCQDTPIIKLTYEAEMIVPKELRALMSAVLLEEKPLDNDFTSYKFEQKMRIPAYLLAIAVGNIKGIKIGPRSTVWSEPEVVEKAANEFTSTEDFIKIGEEYLTPYVWGVYDLLVLPPSFPFGGMENPCLTFVTPTIVVGDKSLVDVVAHEISHSWTGNLVTNSNWQHFWLNEGHTMYLERKILSKLHGEQYRHFSAIIGWNDLKEAVKAYGKEEEYFTSLVPDLRDKDPDDSFSTVPYEKGFNLLFYLEKILGGPEVFDPFLKSYVIHFSNKSLSTNQWKDYLYSYFREHDESKIKVLDSVDWNTWLYGYGMPPVDPKFDRTLLNMCDNLAKKWIDKKNDTNFDEFSLKDIENFDANQLIIFLSRINDEGPYSKTFIEAMDKAYEFSKTKNSEIRFLWQSLCLNSNYEEIFPAVVKFVEEQGRMKFVIPLYRMLFKCKNGADLAVSTFKKNINFYHPICAENIAKELKLK
ncbi:leukotriene A4 hydrolase [Neocallimastix lanati (nom. inval.)]|uniref:Leukotriene A(4) hydrolase n=1 Tax=Neocallimastix californiae TaxID=1754190 RepID=A0A1Y2AT23_9FUNG|nr:leukotriene A4 hydrolase [Neocallimastix sp. JGI-2020a]ORY25702.1 leukotriene A4 hydrolase [Neocallimastix californiae]|eukprot:ORY25702.1 leukotriene A4 hydrolase [Neocallimastix californiae]